MLDFLRGEYCDSRLDEAVLCYGRKADISVGLLELLTLDWSTRLGADESLFCFTMGACDFRNNVTVQLCDIGVACRSAFSPPPLVPQSWLVH